MKRVVLLLILSLSAGTGARAQDLNLPQRLTLEEAIRIARERNPTLAAARNTVEVAEAERLGARLRPNPAVSLLSDNYPLFEPNRPNFFNNQQLTLRVDQELELAGRRRLRGEAAVVGVSVAEGAFLNQARRLELEVRRSYFAVVLAKADADLAQASLAEIDNVISLNRARYEVGEISGGDVRRIQVERLKFVDDQFAAQLALRNARSGLLALLNAPDLGLSFDVVETLDAAGTATPPPTDAPVALDPLSLRAEALAQRPDLRAAQAQVQRADTETLLQRALRTPNMTVGAGYQRNFGADAFVFGVTVPLPIFNKNQGAVARAEAERRQAANLAEAATADVLLEVQQAVNTLDVARSRVQYIEREYLQPARESRDIVLAAYRLGSATLMDYLDAQRAFRDTLRTYNRALYERRLGLFQLAAATGAASTAR